MLTCVFVLLIPACGHVEKKKLAGGILFYQLGTMYDSADVCWSLDKRLH